jgi:hypothetical protein
MSASVALVDSVVANREERRRKTTLQNMKATMRSMIGDVERIEVLGDPERVIAFEKLEARLSLVRFTVSSLREESIELVEAAVAHELEDLAAR